MSKSSEMTIPYVMHMKYEHCTKPAGPLRVLPSTKINHHLKTQNQMLDHSIYVLYSLVKTKNFTT